MSAPKCGTYYLSPEGLTVIAEARAELRARLLINRARRRVVAVRAAARPVQLMVGGRAV